MTQAYNLSQFANKVNTSGQADLTTAVTGVLPLANGGLGITTLTANNVILGNGTSTPTFVAPSTSGNVLTSNGTSWVSSATPVPASLSTATGSPPSYSCRAWAVWNGTAAATILASQNVASITDGGTGIATITFITAMPDTYYAVSGSAVRAAEVCFSLNTSPLTGSCTVRTSGGGGGGGDWPNTSMMVLR